MNHAGLLHGLYADGVDPAAPAVNLPLPRQLAALGTVLCLYRPRHGGELSGWAQAAGVRASTGLDSDGLHESLLFHDAAGQCCWRLYLLPDSDFLAWDRLAASLPQCDEPCVAGMGVGERLWRRLAGRLHSDAWRACVLRLHALPGGTSLAASPAGVSALGVVAARAIVKAEGAEGAVCGTLAGAGEPSVESPAWLP